MTNSDSPVSTDSSSKFSWGDKATQYFFELTPEKIPKLDHVSDMLSHSVHSKTLSFATVLMDNWYASKALMTLIEGLAKTYYCPLKANRNVDDSAAAQAYQRVDSLAWTKQELQHGKRVKLKGFPKHHKVQLFRVTVSTHRTDFVVTNDLAQNSVEVVQKVCRNRWKIEQFHREVKQLTGLEQCQCRKARIQRNHVACACLVWVKLNQLATKTNKSLYQLKYGLLDDYLTSQLKHPAIKMTAA